MSSNDDDDILGISSSPAPVPEPPKRRWERIKIEVRIKLKIKVGLRTEFVQGQGNDVSEGGMAAYVPADLNVDDEVEVEIMVPYGKRPIDFFARVCNRNGFRYGLEFVKVTAANRDELIQSLRIYAIPSSPSQ
jgi:hypothetical protein